MIVGEIFVGKSFDRPIFNKVIEHLQTHGIAQREKLL